MDKDEVMKLAKLARIELGDGEALELAQEFESILRYVSEVEEVSLSAELSKDSVINRNVLREDDTSHESSLYTEELVGRAPERKGDYIKVKKIL